MSIEIMFGTDPYGFRTETCPLTSCLELTPKGLELTPVSLELRHIRVISFVFNAQNCDIYACLKARATT